MFARASRWPLRGVETGIGNKLIFQMTASMSYRTRKLLREHRAVTARKGSFTRTSKEVSSGKRISVTHGESTKAAVNPATRIQESPEQYLKADVGNSLVLHATLKYRSKEHSCGSCEDRLSQAREGARRERTKSARSCKRSIPKLPRP